ncbi:hypothetical protein AMAG_09840 [Allomyces macrogynus ATCC 38327]|uniref:Ubiquinol-cytochrome C reductase hinge domain-containing protein n=1 Tax=Allomyces macrogynus (strain ATCC 38327) TaxID=578462 RepID=A0A0L0SJ12_ALLM3|nr:hypothetical protein GGF32_003872 [Allomyces javanicus]KAJ3373595.1 hypothetical protein GGF31_000436 [Allomyces arbusculus]KNE62444.1 hypothetical protein AMAG_18865 [Allomyces macrogynus ATCC 38327]KNE65876.1 hypothetical protein AMAG_09840 [Allomyces macrogynus ATCC 38327]|eukprot:KNE62444.1 hypothetical protein AMAG_18865 [Allomyces macrogynus ATCC 38327]
MAATDKFINVVHCEEEEEEEVAIQDPKEIIDEACGNTSACAAMKAKMDECTARVEDGAHETCVEEFFHFQKCVDACTSAQLFSKLK